MRKRDLKLKPEPEDGKEKFSLSLPTDVAQSLGFYKELLGAKSMNYIIVEAIRSFLEGDRAFRSSMPNTRPVELRKRGAASLMLTPAGNEEEKE